MSLLIGIHAVAEALAAEEIRVERICVQRGQRNPRVQEIVDRGRARSIPVSFEEKSWLDRKSAGARHQGVLCVTSEVATLDPEDLLAAASSPGLVVLLDGIEDPHNLGAILRSAEVAGADGVFLPKRRAVGLTPAALRSSAGAGAHVKIARIDNTARFMETLKAAGYWIAGLDAAEGIPLWEADYSVATALVLGNESSGLHRLVREKCDFLIRIPVRGKVASYNVSVAAGIALYEVLRQRSSPR